MEMMGREEDDDELGVREERRRAHTENIHHTHSSLSKPMLLMHSLKEREDETRQDEEEKDAV